MRVAALALLLAACTAEPAEQQATTDLGNDVSAEEVEALRSAYYGNSTAPPPGLVIPQGKDASEARQRFIDEGERRQLERRVEALERQD